MSGSDGENDRPARRRLVRARRGRLIGGVCSGLGDHFGVDPILVRIAFVALAIFSGVGIALYLIFVLLVPEEGAGRPPIRLVRSSWIGVLGVVAIVAAAAIALGSAAGGSSGTAWSVGAALGAIAAIGAVAAVVWLRTRGGPGEKGRRSADLRLLSCLALLTAAAAEIVLVAVAGVWLAGTDGLLASWAVVATGAALAVAAFTGGARRLALPAFAFVVSVAVTAAAGVDLHGGVGDRSYHPTTVEEVRDGYRLGAGRLEIDLRGVRFPAGSTALPVRLGIGEVVVVVPKDVCVSTRAQVGGGYVGALDRETGGLDVDWLNRPSPPTTTPRLTLDAHLGLGALFVVDRPLGHDWGWGSGDGNEFQPGAYGGNEACYTELVSKR
jgi:phage shock protein PspC (stress-responsive transcriptional regulator)